MREKETPILPLGEGPRRGTHTDQTFMANTFHMPQTSQIIPLFRDLLRPLGIVQFGPRIRKHCVPLPYRDTLKHET